MVRVKNALEGLARLQDADLIGAITDEDKRDSLSSRVGQLVSGLSTPPDGPRTYLICPECQGRELTLLIEGKRAMRIAFMDEP